MIRSEGAGFPARARRVTALSPVFLGCAVFALAACLPAMAAPTLFSTSASIVGDCVSLGTSGTTSASLSYNNSEIITSCPDGNAIVSTASAQSNGMVSVNSFILPQPGSPVVSLTTTATLTDGLTFCSPATCTGPPGTALGMGVLTATLSGGSDAFGGADSSDYALFTGTINDSANSVMASGTAELADSCVSPLSANCTVSIGDIPVPLTVTIPFPILAGELYTFQMNITVFSSDEGGFLMDDPLSLTLPPGVTVTSASGEFPGSTPEPGTLGTMFIGLIIGVPMALRRRGKSGL